MESMSGCTVNVYSSASPESIKLVSDLQELLKVQLNTLAKAYSTIQSPTEVTGVVINGNGSSVSNSVFQSLDTGIKVRG